MTTQKMNKSEWRAIETRLDRARAAGEELVRDVATPWIDPLAIAAEEHRFLRCIGENFGTDFDGQLEYHRDKRLFLMFYNTRYDRPGDEEHHPRTRFSIAHELAHYFLEHHRAHYLRGGRPQPSKSEFFTPVIMEREADAFASGVLLPSHLVRPFVNECELSTERIDEIATEFRTSRVSTAISAVRLSDFPCALVGVREGRVAWSFRSDCMIEAGLYPPMRDSSLSKDASQRWDAFVNGGDIPVSGGAFAKEWFRTYEKDHLDALPVTEYYLPVPSMDTLVVLLSVPEDELIDLEGDD